VGIAKGAGMIEPNLATMLVYILTDLDIPKDTLRTLLSEVVSESFNCISVDSDESTSDTVVLVSSGKVAFDGSQLAEVKEALLKVSGSSSSSGDGSSSSSSSSSSKRWRNGEEKGR